MGLLNLSIIMLASLGAPAPAPTPVEGKDFVFVCKDAGAGAYEAFPDVCRMKDGRLACVFYAGYTHISYPSPACPKGGRVSVCFSTDEGKTWSPAETLYDGSDDDRDPSITQLSDGRVLVSFFSLKQKEGGYTGLGSWLVESTDACKTWSAPRQISADYYCSSPIRELPDGTLILGLYREANGAVAGATVRSHDKGKTWEPVVDIDNGGLPLDAETDVIRLKDGRLYAAQRTQKEHMRFSVSKDDGKTWSVSSPMPFPGHCPYLYRTPNDIIVCAVRHPDGATGQGTTFYYSLDECSTWSDAVGVDPCRGAYPSLVTLKDGNALIVYYEEGPGSSIRARKFHAEGSGITWLTW